LSRFVKHTNCKSCGSKDNFALYVDDNNHESGHCFGCGFTIPSKEYIEEHSTKQKSRVKKFSERKELENMEVKSTKPAISEEDKQEIKSLTTVNSKDYRGIRIETTKAFGVRHLFDEESGALLEQYYPVTQDGQLVGYKIRELPKTFRSIGRTGADCELFGQFKFNRGGKYVLITEGELDQLSAYQILKDYNLSKGSDFETAVVSPTTGAQSKKQIANQYKFLDSFDQIILGLDNDKAGQSATEEILKHLPKGKVKIMHMRYKDANEYLQQGKDKEFLQDFYGAKAHVPVGVLASSELYERILSQSAVPKVPFPPFMGKLNELFVGGMPLGHIINIAADTGIGKTTLVNELIYYWIFNSPHMIGIVSM
jgi:Zn ribbon nucleic-acid-binding protein